MKPVESVAAFEEALAAAGSPLPKLTPRIGLECMLSFYEEVDAEGCTEQSEDMLLFEWGTYNWGDGDYFELGISRQFIEVGDEGEPNISQLRLVFKYSRSAALVACSEGNNWCGSRAELSEFKQFVHASAGYVLLVESEAANVTLLHSYV